MGAVKKDEYRPYYTYEAYKEWEGDWELINGNAYAMAPSPMFNHQSIAMLIGTSLTESIKKCKRCMVVSEMDYKISDDTILRPDIALVCGQKEGAYIKKSPELIVEIVSQNSALGDEKNTFSMRVKKFPTISCSTPKISKQRSINSTANPMKK